MISTSIVCMELSNQKDLEYIINNSDLVHFDIMDSTYSLCEALTISQIETLSIDTKKIDVHISSASPDQYIDQCIEKKCHMICFPIDSNCDIKSNITKIKSAGLMAGLSIKPDIDLKQLEPYLSFVDYVNIMTVFPGPAGQMFQESELYKIILLREIRDRHNYNYLIEIDGSCNKEHFYSISNAKPDIFVVGKSGLFNLDTKIAVAWKKMLTYMNKKETIYIHADFVGNSLKEPIKRYLCDKGYDLVDLYTDGKEEYPECAARLCSFIKDDDYNIGILFCGTGLGMSIAANKIPGVRATAVSDVFSARAAKEHNNANVLCVGSRVLTPQLAIIIIETFLTSRFLHGKHQSRVNRIDATFGEGTLFD